MTRRVKSCCGRVSPDSDIVTLIADSENVTMRGDILLRPNEARRLAVVERAVKGELTCRQAAGLLQLSVRQVKRLKGEYSKIGAAALAHGNRGRKPKHSTPEASKRLIIELAIGQFRGASHQQMAELLAEHHGLQIGAKTISRILADAHVANDHSHKAPRRRRTRDRMPSAGLLVQGDASPFDWFEDRGPRANLHGFIDDATGMVLAAIFRPTEDLVGYLTCLKQMVELHGIPNAVYTDRSTILFSPKTDKLTIDEELAGNRVHLTHFGQALDALDIRHIAANSPQAKGRIERLWQTLQSRLTIELRLRNVCSIDAANALLPGFITRFNDRFAVTATKPPSFRPAPSPAALEDALAAENVEW